MVGLDKRRRESSTSSEEGGGQRHIKHPATSTTNLRNCEVSGTPGYCSLDDVRHVVREAMESVNSYLIEVIDSRIQNTLIPEIHSSKSAIPELVREATEHAISQMKQVERPPSKHTVNARNLQLCFKSKLSPSLYTGMKLEGHQGCPIQVELRDANTSHVITSGPESSAKLDIVVLKGDFNKEDNKSWPSTEFEHSMVKEREGRRPLLTGELHVNLVGGVGGLGDLRFTDNSSWNSSKKFRIGAKVASGFCNGIRVQEAVTEAFTVKDQRGESYKKHHPPEGDDEVWRLEKIGKDGAYHKRLNEEGIYTVEEFLRHLVGDSKKLKTILGSGMSEKKRSVLINHANTCRSNEKSYVYYCDDKKNDGVVINNLCQLKFLITARGYHPMEQLSDSQKVHAGNMVKAASKNWNHVREFSAESSSGPMINNSFNANPVEIPENRQLCGNQFDHCLTPLSFLGTQDSTAGFHNVNCNYGVGINPPSLIPSHDTNLTNIISEQYANPQNQQETLGDEIVQRTEQQESPSLYWSDTLPL